MVDDEHSVERKLFVQIAGLIRDAKLSPGRSIGILESVKLSYFYDQYFPELRRKEEYDG